VGRLTFSEHSTDAHGHSQAAARIRPQFTLTLLMAGIWTWDGGNDWVAPNAAVVLEEVVVRHETAGR